MTWFRFASHLLCTSSTTSLTRAKIPSQHRASPGSGFAPLLLSLLFHACLALLLWCLVITVTKRESIHLVGSTSGRSQAVPVELQVPDVPATEAAPTESEPTDQEGSNDWLDTLIADALHSGASSIPNERVEELPFVEFFGTRAEGDRFVFVLDISYSMNARRGARFRRACDELNRAVSNLRPGQSYYVFLFCWSLGVMHYDRDIEYASVQDGHENELRNWIYDVSLGAGTDPRRALALAVRMKPDAVFLLSDGEFNQPRTPLSESGWLDADGEQVDVSVQEGVEEYCEDLPIHTIAFENPFTQAAMEAISRATGGQFRYVKTPSLQPIDSARFLTCLKQIDQKHRHETNPTREHQTRLTLARELISDGELLYAEYIMRPLYHASPANILNPSLLKELLAVLKSEVGETRLEDFEQPPELRQILHHESSTSW